MSKEGQALDIHIVLNEICGDGDELFVEYANGPVAYRVRWDGRPRSPPFVWGIDGEMVPAHDAWLTGMNLRAEGMAALVEPDVRDSPEALAAELAAAKDVLIRHAGALQMFFLLATSEGVTTSEQLGNLKLPQFKSLMQRAHVISARYPAERVDEVYASVTTSERTMLRKTDAGINPSIFDLMDFMIALLHVAHQRCARGRSWG